jgi:hypothetical protein
MKYLNCSTFFESLVLTKQKAENRAAQGGAGGGTSEAQRSLGNNP